METIATNPSLYFLGFLFLSLSSFLIKRIRWYATPVFVFLTSLSYLTLTPLGANYLHDQVVKRNNAQRECDNELALLKSNPPEAAPRHERDYASFSEQAFDEVFAAEQWLKRDPSRQVLVSGSRPFTNKSFGSDATLLYNYLLDAGVGREQLIFNGNNASSPYETALSVSALTEERNVSMIANSVELGREKATHEHLGFKVCPLEVDNARIRSWSLFKVLPSGRAVTLSERSLYELVGVIWYQLTGKV